MELLIYGKENCSLCEQAKVTLELLQQGYSFTWKEVNIYEDEKLLEEYHLKIPVIAHQDTLIDAGIVDMSTVENYLKLYNNSENS